LQRNNQSLSIEDPIATLLEIDSTIGKNLAEVSSDATIFGRNGNIPLYIYMTDVLDLAIGNQELNIFVIQLWIM